MLVLSRKAGERIQIGENITLVVSRVVGNRVTIGIEAPSDVRIVRGELAPLVEEFAELPAEKRLTPELALVGGASFGGDFATTYVPRCAR